MTSLPPRSKVVAVVSDIHFNLHCEATWKAFRAWVRYVKPDEIVIAGDFLDLGMMSHYAVGADDPLDPVDQIQLFVRETRALLKHTPSLVVMEGNHDERWGKVLLGENPSRLRKAKGLSLREQCLSQGLDPSVKWLRETTHATGYRVGQFWIRHGHRQAARFGGGRHIAANRISKTFSSEIIGHHHKAQLFCQTIRSSRDRDTVVVGIANPCMTRDHSYALAADWQRGFTILELSGERATPYVVLIEGGKFSWGGRVFDGNR